MNMLNFWKDIMFLNPPQHNCFECEDKSRLVALSNVPFGTTTFNRNARARKYQNLTPPSVVQSTRCLHFQTEAASSSLTKHHLVQVSNLIHD
mmetsp:Transcript_9070/g.18194  ORF Transcript_9070/g.18194 Transcript_9070/m.18194 type:complete len:92 (+) Transcript_9070:740-1015(+)